MKKKLTISKETLANLTKKKTKVKAGAPMAGNPRQTQCDAGGTNCSLGFA